MIFALKMIDLQQVREEDMEPQLIEEIKLQLFMNHPNVLKMYGCFRDGHQLCMILEYADEKCLFAKMSQKVVCFRCSLRRKQQRIIQDRCLRRLSIVTRSLFCIGI
jgi:serine/threonine protein kinase